MLSIKGRQTIDAENENIELLTEGGLTEKEGMLVLQYNETEISGVNGMKTSITLNGDTVLMERDMTQFLFQQGRRFEGNYQTPYGTMKMSVFPTRVYTQLNRDDGRVELEYELSLEGKYSMNQMSLYYKKIKSNMN